MQIGQVISGKYRLLRLIGDGGMGAVFEAHHEVLGARVAIKVLHEDLARKPELVDRFLREARVLAQINSPHVVRVLDIALAEGGSSAYIVMELLTGEALSDLIARVRRLPLDVAVDYAGQILEALEAAHALGVVHRDLKPENVFITRDGARTVLKVIDFGIAKVGTLGGAPSNLTVSGALMGTPEYMAPEQAHSADRADARSDLFAVGVMLYEMLSGARPVDGDDPRLVALKVERGEVQPLIHRVPEIPRDLAGLVHRAMAPRPELRFSSAAEMHQALDAVMAGRRASQPGIVAGPPATPPPPAPVAASPSPVPPRGTGTMFAVPAADVPGPQSAVAGPPARETDPGAGPYTPQYIPPSAVQMGAPPAYPVAAPAWSPPAQGAPAGGPQGYGAPPPPGRGRPRRAGGTMWLLGGLAVVAAGGLAVALVVTGTASPGPRPAPTPVTVTSAAAEPASTGSSIALDPSIPPLPTPSGAPVPHAVVAPTPHGSTSGAPNVSPTAPPHADNPPFGVPPFSFPTSLPTSIPNPFPGSASSGVGPVITIPTSFPPFNLPTDPPQGPPPPHRGRR